MRIVSLLPSATEIVCGLGLGIELVGVSHECDYPADALTKPKLIEPVFDTLRMGSEEIDELVRESIRQGRSLYRIKSDELKLADPDLIITQDLCDVCAVGASDVLEAVNKLGKSVRVLSLNPHTLRDIKDDVRNIAKTVGCPEQGERLVAEFEAKADVVRKLTADTRKIRVFCAEWLNPLMSAGHWVPECVTLAGGVDRFASQGGPSTRVDWNSVLDYDPEVVVLMPCGFITERTVREAQDFLRLTGVRGLAAFRAGRIYATNGHSYFSRSGPRIFDGIQILARMIHPELFPNPLDPELGVRIGGLVEV